MYEPLVSIIIPVYNVSAYLKQCLNSVITQTYQNLEILLIDDGSEDNSGKICDDFALKDKRISVFHTKNNGLSASRNVGLKKLKGTYVTFVDSDDYIDKQYIEILVEAAIKYSSSLVIGSYIKFTDKHLPQPAVNHILLEKQYIVKYSSREAISNMLYRKELSMYSHGKLYNSNLFHEICFPRGRLFEDVPVTWNIMKQIDNVIFINLPLYYYRQRDGSIINSSFSSSKMDQAYFAKSIVDEVYGDKELYKAAVSKYFFCLADLYTQVDSKHVKEKRILESELKKYSPLVKKNTENSPALKILATLGNFHVYFIRILGKAYKYYNKLKLQNQLGIALCKNIKK